MKKATAMIAAVCLVGGLSAAEDDYFASNGGMVQLRGKGFVAVIDCRDKPEPSDCKAGVDKVKDTFNIDIKEMPGASFTVSNAAEQLRSSGGNAAVFIADDPALPLALCAIEEKWAMLNAAKLRGGAPDGEKLRRRFAVMFIRQCCRVLGSDETKATDCCFHPVFGVEDIDKTETLDITMNPYMSITEVMGMRGIEEYEFGTYYDACEMGVASAPTNDVQKAIWDKVHQLPTQPIRILPESKRGKK